MDDERASASGRGRRWTLRFLMAVIAVSALVCALVRPFATGPRPSGQVIGIEFNLQETRQSDGTVVSGLAPTITVTQQPGVPAQPRKR